MEGFVEYCIAAAVGAALHLTIFIRGEWHLSVLPILLGHLVAYATLVILSVNEHTKPTTAAYFAARLSITYFCGLFSSIGVRNREFQRHMEFTEWQCQGPEEITLFHPRAFEIMDGARNQNTKTDVYDLIHSKESALFTRLNIFKAALDSIQPTIRAQTTSLGKAIELTKDKPVTVEPLFLQYAFDSMGKIVFPQAYNEMPVELTKMAAVQQKEALAAQAFFLPVPWLASFALQIMPKVWKIKAWHDTVDTSIRLVRGRSRIASEEQKDSKFMGVAPQLIDEYESSVETTSPERRRNILYGNAISLLFAASDTTTSVLTILTYHLAKYPGYAAQVHEEVKSFDTSKFDTFAALPHLNAFIKESMRILPAVLTFGARKTPPEGVDVDGVHIPGGVSICISRYTISRLEDAFVDADSFRPERWGDSPELVRDVRANSPFGIGRRGCVGKHWAMMQIRHVIANILSKYSISFAPGTDVDSIERDMTNDFTATMGKFDVVFTPRPFEW